MCQRCVKLTLTIYLEISSIKKNSNHRRCVSDKRNESIASIYLEIFFFFTTKKIKCYIFSSCCCCLFLPYYDFQCKKYRAVKMDAPTSISFPLQRPYNLLYQPKNEKTKLEPEENSNNIFRSLPAPTTQKGTILLRVRQKKKDRNFWNRLDLLLLLFVDIFACL